MSPEGNAVNDPISENRSPLDWAHIHTIVIKLGTQLLSDERGRLDAQFMSSIARQIAQLREKHIRATIVSSGAVGAGVAELELSKRPTDLARLQAVAAVGQRKLMDAWADAFAPAGLPVAQLLLTRQDIDHRTRFLNVRNTIHAAQEMGAVPIINENDTISTDELAKITFGDNDYLAAVIASALRADLLVLLTVVDGLLDPSGNSVRIIHSIDEARQLVRKEKSAPGKGGMDSKLEAAKLMTDAGEALIVADGRADNILPRILAGETVGTLFVPATRRRSGRGRWIGAARPAGAIIIDAGAVKALVERNKSLLAAGVVKVDGTFSRGGIVEIFSPDGRAVARGLSNYNSDDLERIRGKQSAEIRALLGDAAYDEVVHRDNLIVASL
jgi:glutamate 5-kinase